MGHGGIKVRRHHHAFAGSQTILLHHVRSPKTLQSIPRLVQSAAGYRGGGSDPSLAHYRFRECFRALQAGGQTSGAENSVTRLTQDISNPFDQRGFRPNDHQVGTQRLGQFQHLCRVISHAFHVFAHRGGTGITGGNPQFLQQI